MNELSGSETRDVSLNAAFFAAAEERGLRKSDIEKAVKQLALRMGKGFINSDSDVLKRY